MVSARTWECFETPTTAKRWSNSAVTSPARRWPTNAGIATLRGQVVLKLKRAWYDGTTDLVISPMVFM
jgi:hypothetical protein